MQIAISDSASKLTQLARVLCVCVFVYCLQIVVILFLKLVFIGVQLICKFRLVSVLQQSKSVIQEHISLIFRLFSHIGHYTVLNSSLCYTVDCYLLSVLFIVVCIQQSPSSNLCLPTSLLVTINLYSKSVSLFLFCK